MMEQTGLRGERDDRAEGLESCTVRKAAEADISAVEQIYNDLLDFQESGINYTNWKKGLYPTRRDAEKAFREGTLYVAELSGGKLGGCVILNHIQPPEYGKIPWSVQAEPREVLVIHTLCISPDHAKKKLGVRLVSFAEELARALGCRAVRLDTYEGNAPAISLYTKLGYTYAGSAPFLFQNIIPETLTCFEKEV